MYKALLIVAFVTQLLNAECLSSTSKDLTNDELQKTLQCFQDEINELKKATIVKVVQIEGLEKPTISKSMTKGNFRFDLHECKRQSDQVLCNITITNIGKKDDVFQYYGGGKTYDEKGKVYKVSDKYILDELGTTKREAIAKIPMKSHFIIKDFDKDSTIFSALKIGTSRGQIFFKNIAIH
jgi:hypothetical protein